MGKAIIDKKKIDEVLTRGVEKIYPDKSSLAKVLSSGKKIRLYCGFDPSAPTLHIGNAIQLSKLAQFQALGHEVIFLVGDFTGMIGDPTDKTAARKKLTRQEVLANAKNYKKQASIFLNFFGRNKAKIKYNSKWNDKLNFKDLIELSSNFTVQQMLTRDMFQERLKKEEPIYFHEFLYPLAQGYDSVAMDVDLEIGGNDQMFNMMAGRGLMKAIKNKEKFVLTTKLLVDANGQKMGKTEGNMITLDDEAKEVYGKIMSWPDEFILPGFELCTKVEMNKIEEIAKKIKQGKNPRDYKMQLAREIVKIYHGEKEAKEAEEYFVKTVQKKEAPNEVESQKLKVKSINIVDLLVKIGLASSKSEARRLIEQGGIKINEQVIGDINTKVELTKDGVLVQRGKRQFIKVIGS